MEALTLDKKTVLEELLNEAIRLEQTTKGSLQKYNPVSQELQLICYKGFSENFFKHFQFVKPFDGSCCGRVFGIGGTVTIDDLELDKAFKCHIDVARAEAFRAVKSVPVINAHGKKLGMISVHFTEPRWNWESKYLENFMPKVADALEALD